MILAFKRTGFIFFYLGVLFLIKNGSLTNNLYASNAMYKNLNRYDSLSKYLQTINTQSLLVYQNDKIVYSYGDVNRKLNIHSIRKSLLSTLYGKYVLSGTINLKSTMADLGIDDKDGLTATEKQATIEDCLMARSGVYHFAAYETQNMKDRKPNRGQHLPGTFFSYNNWDFNVLGTFFNRLTQKDLFQAFKDDIAVPIGMKDYQVSDGEYVQAEESFHQAYPFRMSNRDLALFGQLMLHKGKWNGVQIVNESWINRITAYHSDAASYKADGYGYMWWVNKTGNAYKHFVAADVPDGTYSARGAGGHYLVIIPSLNMVVSHRVDTDIKDNRVSEAEFSKILNFLLNE